MKELEVKLGFSFSNRLEITYTDMDKDLISDTILLGCACFCQEFKTVPNRKVNFNLYSNIEEMKADGISDGSIDGSFCFATEPYPETLFINLSLRQDFLIGCQRLFIERETPTKLSSATRAEVELRGNQLLSFFSTMEVILHEFSHAVNYEKIMDATGWVDLNMPVHNPDYFLCDEFLAKYCSILASLKMITEIENALFFAVCQYQFEDLSRKLSTTIERINAKRQEFEMYGFSLGELKRTVKCVEMTRETVGNYYAFDNPMATYDGTQMLGFIQACYDFLNMDTRKRKGILTEDEKKLQYWLKNDYPFHKSHIFKGPRMKQREIFNKLAL